MGLWTLDSPGLRPRHHDARGRAVLVNTTRAWRAANLRQIAAHLSLMAGYASSRLPAGRLHGDQDAITAVRLGSGRHGGCGIIEPKTARSGWVRCRARSSYAYGEEDWFSKGAPLCWIESRLQPQIPLVVFLPRLLAATFFSVLLHTLSPPCLSRSLEHV